MKQVIKHCIACPCPVTGAQRGLSDCARLVRPAAHILRAPNGSAGRYDAHGDQQRTKAKMEQMVARGYFCGGQPPFGYRQEIVTDACNCILGEIKRAAKHPTRLRALIAEAVKELPEPGDIAKRRAESSRALREAERRIARIQEAIEPGGGALRSLAERLQALETKRVTLAARHQETTAQAEAQRVRRPDVEEVCAVWGRIVELWGAATDNERETILQAIVGRVEMTEKESGTCALAFLPQVPDSRFELTDQMGAGVGFEPTTFGL
jgi:hypothetical protein